VTVPDPFPLNVFQSVWDSQPSVLVLACVIAITRLVIDNGTVAVYELPPVGVHHTIPLPVVYSGTCPLLAPEILNVVMGRVPLAMIPPYIFWARTGVLIDTNTPMNIVNNHFFNGNTSLKHPLGCSHKLH
jgi:hypothetical protein